MPEARGCDWRKTSWRPVSVTMSDSGPRGEGSPARSWHRARERASLDPCRDRGWDASFSLGDENLRSGSIHLVFRTRSPRGRSRAGAAPGSNPEAAPAAAGLIAHQRLSPCEQRENVTGPDGSPGRLRRNAGRRAGFFGHRGEPWRVHGSGTCPTHRAAAGNFKILANTGRLHLGVSLPLEGR